MDFFHQLVLLQGFILSYLEFSKGLFLFIYFNLLIKLLALFYFIFFSAVIVLVASSEGNG